MCTSQQQYYYYCDYDYYYCYILPPLLTLQLLLHVMAQHTTMHNECVKKVDIYIVDAFNDEAVYALAGFLNLFY